MEKMNGHDICTCYLGEGCGCDAPPCDCNGSDCAECMYDRQAAREAYLAHMKSTTPATSNKATSYVRALDLLAQVLVSDGADFWAIRDGAQLDALYVWCKAAQKDTSSRLYADGMPRSYASGGYYSAALNEYRTFMGGR